MPVTSLSDAASLWTKKKVPRRKGDGASPPGNLRRGRPWT